MKRKFKKLKAPSKKRLRQSRAAKTQVPKSRLAKPNEDKFIEHLKTIFGSPSGATIGIGDDAAVFPPPRKGKMVWTTDSHIEDVHFKWNWLSPTELGNRAAAASLSDIAAMGARPLYGLVSFDVPHGLKTEKMVQIARGIQQMFTRFGSSIVGGNVTASATFAIHIAVVGTTANHAPWLRSSARPGDYVYVTGVPGGAALALSLLKAGDKNTSPEFQRVLNLWRKPTPRIREALELGGRVHAGIDISDGLLCDAERIAKASEVDIVIEASRLPFPPYIRQVCRQKNLSWIDLQFEPSDDYELLFTTRQELETDWLKSPNGGVRRIGQVQRGTGKAWLLNMGTKVPLKSRTWDALS